MIILVYNTLIVSHPFLLNPCFFPFVLTSCWLNPHAFVEVAEANLRLAVAGGDMFTESGL